MSAEAPRLETPCQLKPVTVVSHDAARPCRDNTRRPSGGCGTPVATAPPRTVSRVQARVATNRDILLRPGVGEGRNNVLKRVGYASLVSESAHDRDSPSGRIEEQNRTDRE